jgi:hypothetical protein
MIQWESDFAYIAAVMVHPEFRRQGIGRALVSEAVRVAFGYGAKKAVLHVREDNLPAKNLYLSLGFQAFETRVNLLREASPLPQEKPLPPRFQIVKTAPWEERAREALRASRSPKALEVYGFPNPPRGIARLFSSPRKVFLLLRDGKALGLMSLYPGKVLQLRAHLAQEGVSEAAAQAFLIRGLRAAPGRKRSFGPISKMSTSSNPQKIWGFGRLAGSWEWYSRGRDGKLESSFFPALDRATVFPLW